MSRRAARIDGNQTDIVDALRADGCSVAVTSACGNGFPDLTVGFGGPGGYVVLMEVKDPSQAVSDRVLTARQKTWHREWRGPAHVIETVEQALAVVAFYRQGRKVSNG